MEGRLSPFIELGVGFNPDLAAEDNVIINAVMMGLSRTEARRRFKDIVAFAELEEFVDLKLKNYSSGMAVRLGFAVSTQVDADVLLVDEVLAVGDASFQQKCFEVFQRLKDEGKTILFVTHDMGAGRALLRPGDAARARADALDRRAARDRPALQPGELRRARPRRARGEPRPRVSGRSRSGRAAPRWAANR